jgi:hypothetical protein
MGIRGAAVIATSVVEVKVAAARTRRKSVRMGRPPIRTRGVAVQVPTAEAAADVPEQQTLTVIQHIVALVVAVVAFARSDLWC